MTSVRRRSEILAGVVAHLEAERFSPGPRDRHSVARAPRSDPPPPITAEQAAEHLRVLEEALSDDRTVVAMREREAS